MVNCFHRFGEVEQLAVQAPRVLARSCVQRATKFGSGGEESSLRFCYKSAVAVFLLVVTIGVTRQAPLGLYLFTSVFSRHEKQRSSTGELSNNCRLHTIHGHKILVFVCIDRP